MNKLFVDIETRSTCDLRKCGVYVYAEHPSTEIIVICWAVDDGPMRTWKLGDDDTMLETLRLMTTNVRLTWVAHNAGFERTVMCGHAGKRLGLAVPTDLARWDCTAARAAAVGLPRSLEGASNAIGLDVKKDKTGHGVMMRMCKPRPGTGPGTEKPIAWFDAPAMMGVLAAYCAQDVEVERALDRVLPALSPMERRAWELTERMNDRGVAVDEKLLVRMSLLIEDATRAVNASISAKTKGAVPKISNHMALTRWLDSQGIDDALETGVGKAAVAAILENKDVDPLVREVLLIRRDGGGSSSSKYRAILNRVSRDGRIRGVLFYCGAAATGRWSSRGAQLHNLPRGGTVEDIEGAIDAVLTDTPLGAIEFMFGPPLIVASELLRPVFIAGGE